MFQSGVSSRVLPEKYSYAVPSSRPGFRPVPIRCSGRTLSDHRTRFVSLTIEGRMTYRRQHQPRVVVITGASAGVGRATVREFAREGAWIGLVARSRDGLEGARKEVEVAGGVRWCCRRMWRIPTRLMGQRRWSSADSDPSMCG